MPAPPARADLFPAGALAPATFKTKLAEFFDYAVALLGASGTPAAARTALGFTKGADVASAGALTLGTDGNYFDITGTTAITSIGTLGVGTVVRLHFDGVLTFTHHTTDLVLPGAANITTAAGDEATLIEYATGDWRLIGYTRLSGAPVINAGHGQCEVIKSGANLVLMPKNGNKLIIGGVSWTVPAGGTPGLAPPAVANTNYYIYAYISAGAIALEYSTTGHATDATTGVEIKSGDASRTLVAFVTTNASNAWVDTETQRFVRSYFNRKPMKLRNSFTATRSTGAGSFTELNTEIRCGFTCFADDVIEVSVVGSASNSDANVGTATAVGWDGATTSSNLSDILSNATGLYNNCSCTEHNVLAEGNHYITVMGVVTAGTGSWGGGPFAGIYTSLSGVVR